MKMSHTLNEEVCVTISNDKDPPKQDSRAIYRFQMVSAVLARVEQGEIRKEAIEVVSRQSNASPRSLYRWLKAFETHGFAGLASETRKSIPKRVSNTVMAFVIKEKEADPSVSVPELIRRAENDGLVVKGVLKRATLWRAMKKLGIPTRKIKKIKAGVKRRFAYPHRMQMVLCDGKHFRVGPNRTKRVALFFIDDATRFVLATVVGPSESGSLFLAGLYRCIRDFGLMQRLYLDNGSAFTAGESAMVLATLGVRTIHGTVGYPQGRGKVERFNRTAAQDLLRHWDMGDVDADCNSLARRLRHYMY